MTDLPVPDAPTPPPPPPSGPGGLGTGPGGFGEILPQPLSTLLSEKYLAYSVSAIARTLPDVRDGLKPVHRRLLFAMTQLRLASGSSPKKCARVVGDVIGKFHPHGDLSVYDALVRLAQDFAQRYPLVDGHGNFGNVDGDNPAAMRYTEARLTAVAEALLEGLNEDAVDFRATYDGDGDEPVVLPAAFPNLLANGAQGIAVGMATNIPPHNVDELCQALTLLIQQPDAPLDALVDLVPGPDFPTGGVLVEDRATILEAYRSGRGSLRVRAQWAEERMGGGQYQIVITEIPYQVQKSKLVERIASLLEARKLPLLEDVRDESAEDVRLVLVPKSRNVDAGQLMESLFRATDLESRFALNMNVLDHGTTPRVMNLKEVLQAFLAHRLEVLERRSRHRLGQIEHRLEVLAGFLIAYLNLDEVIALIRQADDPKAALMERFALSAVQADAILALRLRQLNKLEELEIRREHAALEAERDQLTALLRDEALRWRRLGEEVAEMRRRFGAGTLLGFRRTRLGVAPPVVDIAPEAVIEKEPVTVLISRLGWIKALKGHVGDVSDVRYKDGDGARFVLRVSTTDRLLVLATDGRVYTLGCDGLPSGRGFGEPVRLSVGLEAGADLAAVLPFQPGQMLLIASSDGRGFRVLSDQLLTPMKAGKQVLGLNPGATAAALVPAAGDTVAVIGTHRKLLCFPAEQVLEMARGKGVVLQKYQEASLSDVQVFNRADGLTWTLGERTRVERGEGLEPYLGTRAQVGRAPPAGFPKSNRFSG